MNHLEKAFLIGQIVTIAMQEEDVDLIDFIFKLLVNNMKPQEDDAV